VIGAIGVSRFKKGTSYTVTFAEPLNAQSANNLGLYRLFQGVKKLRQTVFTKALKIKSVVYNAGAHSETITVAKPVKGAVEVVIEPGLQAANGAVNSGAITEIAP
jgi:hypothetical protein